MNQSSALAKPAVSHVTNAQFEVTTRCNFKCAFCAGREMRQGDMSFDDFCQTFDAHIERYGIPEEVSLQGEGEPTLNHDFFRMAAYVRAKGAHVYTITNGTCKHPERFAESFQVVGVSVDSLDPDTSESLGRINLPGTLRFIDELAKHVEAVVIHSIYLSTHTKKIAEWCKEHGYHHVIQRLQSKDDYAKKYPTITLHRPQGKFSCPVLFGGHKRYYNLDLVEMPCPHIKDVSNYKGIESMLEEGAGGNWPRVCSGCSLGGK